ncbi:hypothetical protein [Winogradskyella sp.]|uniref:hypothetical protein n=1 Tax=Winogradskyella sp. TaxID=1883156 RepID=UPI003F6B9501
MKFQILLILACLTFLLGCSNDDETSTDNLNQTGIIGNWEFSDEEIDGISDLLPKCCKFFEFKVDENKQDLTGLFTYTGDTNEFTEGSFIVDETGETITFLFDDEQRIYNYTMSQSQDYITFSFFEDGSNSLQGWTKID